MRRAGVWGAALCYRVQCCAGAHRRRGRRALLLLREGRQGDYARPLAILKDELEDLVLPALARNQGELRLEQRYQPEQMRVFAQRYAAKAMASEPGAVQENARARCLETLQLLAALPSRSSLVPEVGARYSERLFRRVYGETRALITGLGLFEQYERRTGRP